MRRFIPVLIISLLALPYLTFACDCGSTGTFLTAAPKADLVALVKVTKYLTFISVYDQQTPRSMEVEIVRIFKGNEKRKSVVVWGDNGNQCRPYISKFATGKYYVIAFYKDPEHSGGHTDKGEETTDYFISICGNYWLNADSEKKVATGSVSKNQDKISFDDLWKHFNSEKTRELEPNDFREIFQLALDVPKLQPYFHINSNSSRKQVYFQYFGDAHHDNLAGVKKFDRQVIILTEEEIKKQNIKYYFMLSDWVCLKDIVRMQLFYVGEGVLASYLFKKVHNHWIIDNSHLLEE